MEVAPKVKSRRVGKQDVRTPEQKKIATIEKVYYDKETGYQNIRETWKAAKVLDNSITENDVKKWKATLEARSICRYLATSRSSPPSPTRSSRSTCCFSPRKEKPDQRQSQEGEV